jgi:hypothetical protein
MFTQYIFNSIVNLYYFMYILLSDVTLVSMVTILWKCNTSKWTIIFECFDGKCDKWYLESMWTRLLTNVFVLKSLFMVTMPTMAMLSENGYFGFLQPNSFLALLSPPERSPTPGKPYHKLQKQWDHHQCVNWMSSEVAPIRILWWRATCYTRQSIAIDIQTKAMLFEFHQ